MAQADTAPENVALAALVVKVALVVKAALVVKVDPVVKEAITGNLPSTYY